MSQIVNLFKVFYVSPYFRLRDHHSLLPSTLHGLSLLTRHQDLDTTLLETLLNTLQTEVMVQQQVVRDRSTVFLMLSRHTYIKCHKFSFLPRNDKGFRIKFLV